VPGERSSGRGYRLPAEVLTEALENTGAVGRLTRLYTPALMTRGLRKRPSAPGTTP